MINKDLINKALASRWDLKFNEQSKVLTKFVIPEIVRFSGTLDQQVKQLRDGGFEEIVIEELSVAIKENPDARRVSFVISDESVDRHGDTVSMAGWDLSQYQKTVLWSHDHSLLPVGKAIKTWKHSGKLKSITEFVPKELNPFGWAVGELTHAGFINATSVGFIPHDGELNEERTESTGQFSLDFTKQELIEYSVCNIGSNRNALVEGKFFEEAEKIVAEVGRATPQPAVIKTYTNRPQTEGELTSLADYALEVFKDGR